MGTPRRTAPNTPGVATAAPQATIAHLQHALTASEAGDTAGVTAGLLRAIRALDETRYPEIAAAIRTARNVDPESRTVRQYIRALLRRLIAVVNCWEPHE